MNSCNFRFINIRHSLGSGNQANKIIPCEARAKVNGLLFKTRWIPAYTKSRQFAIRLAECKIVTTGMTGQEDGLE